MVKKSPIRSVNINWIDVKQQKQELKLLSTCFNPKGEGYFMNLTVPKGTNIRKTKYKTLPFHKGTMWGKNVVIRLQGDVWFDATELRMHNKMQNIIRYRMRKQKVFMDCQLLTYYEQCLTKFFEFLRLKLNRKDYIFSITVFPYWQANIFIKFDNKPNLLLLINKWNWILGIRKNIISIFLVKSTLDICGLGILDIFIRYYISKTVSKRFFVKLNKRSVNTVMQFGKTKHNLW